MDDITKDKNKHEIINFHVPHSLFWCLNILGIEVKILNKFFYSL